jgi:hypothetical protein
MAKRQLTDPCQRHRRDARAEQHARQLPQAARRPGHGRHRRVAGHRSCRRPEIRGRGRDRFCHLLPVAGDARAGTSRGREHLRRGRACPSVSPGFARQFHGPAVRRPLELQSARRWAVSSAVKPGLLTTGGSDHFSDAARTCVPRRRPIRAGGHQSRSWADGSARRAASGWSNRWPGSAARPRLPSSAGPAASSGGPA